MSKFIVTPTEPRPSWLRRKARRRWDKERATTQAIIDYLEDDIMDETTRVLLKMMLYGFASVMPDPDRIHPDGSPRGLD